MNQISISIDEAREAAFALRHFGGVGAGERRRIAERLEAAIREHNGRQRTQGELVADAEADRMAARQGYNPNR